MTFHSFLLLLSFFFILCLAWLWHLDWSHHVLQSRRAKSRSGRKDQSKVVGIYMLEAEKGRYS
jgi:hypothetical protein